MKRLLYVFIITITLLGLVGCSFDKTIESTNPINVQKTMVIKKAPINLKPAVTPNPTQTPTPTPNDNKTVVAEGFFFEPLDENTKERITGLSYPAYEQSDITYDSLNYIGVLHYDFEGNVCNGELIVAKDLAQEVTHIFYQLYLAEYPIHSILLIDEFGGSTGDNASMSANNTSAFNYRTVSGTNKLSNHALGRAIDINPMMNPYVKGDYVSPKSGADYIDRDNIRTGMIDENDLCYKLFKQNGWEWGGSWIYSKDYQHFEKE